MNVCSAVHVFGLDRFSPTVLAVPPSYDPENVRVPLVAVREPSVPPRETPLIVEFVRPVLSNVPVIDGVNVCVSPDDVITSFVVSPLNATDDVANVCDAPVWNDEYCAPIDVIPPPAPASAPQVNCPVAELYSSLSPDVEHEVKPAPYIYPEPRFNPFVISTPPAIVDVAVVLVALKLPNVGVDVATTCPDAFVESSELTAAPVYVSVFVNPFSPENVFESPSNVDDAAPDSDVKNPASFVSCDVLIVDVANEYVEPLAPTPRNPVVSDGSDSVPIEARVDDE